MRALILAAGYATRMYPLTRDLPKALLPLGGRPIVDRIVDRIARVDDVESLVVVTNSKFLRRFLRWRDRGDFNLPVEVIDDGTSTNDERLGAIGDIRLSLELVGPGGDWLVAAGDNVFPYDFQDVVDLFHTQGGDVVTCYPQPDRERLRRTGVAVLTGDGRVLDFEEKPPEPRSQWAVPPLYVFTEATLRELQGYLEAGNPSDAPGHFVRWLCRRKPVWALQCEEGPHDIGTIEGYREAERLYRQE